MYYSLAPQWGVFVCGNQPNPKDGLVFLYNTPYFLINALWHESISSKLQITSLLEDNM